MEGKNITVDALVKKGYVKEDRWGPNDIYSKQLHCGEQVILYNPMTEKVIISARNTVEEMRKGYKRWIILEED